MELLLGHACVTRKLGMWQCDQKSRIQGEKYNRKLILKCKAFFKYVSSLMELALGIKLIKVSLASAVYINLAIFYIKHRLGF